MGKLVSLGVGKSVSDDTFKDGGGITPNNAINRPGEYFVFDFSVYRDTLTLTPVEGEISPSTSGPSRGVGSPTQPRVSTSANAARRPPPRYAISASHARSTMVCLKPRAAQRPHHRLEGHPEHPRHDLRRPTHQQLSRCLTHEVPDRPPH